MPSIPKINIKSLRISDISVDSSTVIPPTNLFNSPPVTINIGTPIVNIPGCVETHKDSKLKNKNLLSDDPNGSIVICDSTVPSYDPIEYQPENMIITKPAKTPKVNPSKPPDPVEAIDIPSKLPTPPSTVNCTPNQKYNAEKNICEQIIIEEKPSFKVEDFVPDPAAVFQTSFIAASAATAALVSKPIADFLLKLVKPIVKKVVKKISTKLGKKEKVKSVFERIQEQRNSR